MRRLGLLAVSVMTLLALVGPTATAPAYAAAVKTTLTASYSATSIISGRGPVVTATLKKGSKAVPGVSVKLQKRTVGTKKWVTFGTKKTSSQGKVMVFTSGLIRNTEFRAISSGTPTYKAAASKVNTLTVVQKVSVTKTSTRTPAKGTTVTIKGTTTPGLSGKTIQLHKKAGSSWTKVSSAKVTAKSTFTVTAKAGNAGKATYRVYAPATDSTQPATSTKKPFTVYQWFPLKEAEPIDGPEWDDGTFGLIPDTGEIAGTFQSDALFGFLGRDDNGDTIGSEAWSVWELAGTCMSFSAKVGIFDDSDLPTTAHFAYETHAEGYLTRRDTMATRSSGQKALPVKVDVTGAEFLKLEAYEDYAYWPVDFKDKYAYPAFVDSKVLCSGRI